MSVFEELGFRATSIAGDVAAGFIPGEQVKQLMEHPDTIAVEVAPSLTNGAKINQIAINLFDPVTNERTIPSHGHGAIIGIIDSGFDLTHPCFFDAQSKTRILAAWDQVNLLNATGAAPEPFAYGVEHTKEMIDQYVADQKIVVIKNDPGAGRHGTSVAGIAAGNGAPDGLHVGIAPEAELILVTNRNDVPIGGSPFVLDAIKYILDKARASHKPVCINISQGDSLGAHDGTSLLERAIDHYVEQEGISVVCSAGNAGGRKRHVAGRVLPGISSSLTFNLKISETRVVDRDVIELWYRKEDSFAVALKTSDGWQSQFVQPDSAEVITFPAGTKAYITSETANPGNGDNRISIILEHGEGWTTGPWQVILMGNEVVHGDFHAWADRPNAVTVISFTEASDDCTITLPGTSRQIITVSGFISRPADGISEGNVPGALQPLTSLGLTRDNSLKPDLTAPGFIIIAPEEHVAGDDNPLSYFSQMGTSMAAPHVSGVIALLLALMPDLTAQRIKDALYATAQVDSFTGTTPNASWGRGKLNAGGAYHVLSTSQPSEGGTIMSDSQIQASSPAKEPKTNEQVHEMNLIVTKDEGEPSIVTVRVHVKGGNMVSIEGSSGGKKYIGTLSLEAVSSAEGGDECIICNPTCQEVVPCPTSRPRPE